MFRAVRCTTALLAVLATSACGTSPTAPTPARKAPELATPEAKASAGHAVALPLQRSSTSQLPAEPRQTLPDARGPHTPFTAAPAAALQA